MSKIAAGTILILESGEYSDKSWHGPFRVLKDFDQAEISQTFRDNWSPGPDSWRDKEDGPGRGDFLSWLVRNGYVEDLDGVVAWHIGSYEFDPTIHPDKVPA